MRLHENIDFTTLTWVKPELDETLRQARNALQNYVEEGESPAELRTCSDLLHQVQGTLRMVELYGAAMVAEEMEQLARALIDGKVVNRDPAYAVLMQGIVQLPDYLERLQSGHRDIPIVLLPLLNQLRESRGEKGLNESVLFSPDLSRPLPPSAQGPDAPMDPAELTRRAETLRGLYQGALLRWLKDDNSPATIRDLTDVCEQLVPITWAEPARRLFWVAAGTLDALGKNAFPISNPLKQALSKVEREIKRLAEGGDAAFRANPPIELTKQLLYFVAHEGSDTGRIGEIRNVFGLSGTEPSEAELAHARGSLSGNNRALLETVAVAIKEDLLRVKDALDLHLRTPDASVTDLGVQVEALDRVADTLGMLGLGVPRRVVQDQRTAINDVISGQRKGDEETLLDIAGALLYVEAALDDQVERLGKQDTAAGDSAGAPPSNESRRLLEVLVKEAIVNFAAARQAFVAFVETHWDHSQLAQVPRLLTEVSGALRILNIQEPADYLIGIRQFTDNELLRRKQVPNGQQMDRLADALASLEYFLEALRDRRPNREQILEVAKQSLTSLGYWPLTAEMRASAPAADAVPTRAPAAPSAPAAAAPVEPSALPASAQLPVAPAVVLAGSISPASPVPAPAPASASALVPAASAPAPAPAPIPTPAIVPVPAAASAAANPVVPGFDGSSSEEIDDEIREVFLEEFEEEIDNLSQLLPAWRQEPASAELLRPIRRVFHTLKGSGRLVGAKTLGEFSWKVESLLNRVLDGSRPASPQVIGLVQLALDNLPLLRAALQGQEVRADLEGLQATADLLAAGEEVSYAAAAAPAGAVVAEAEPAAPVEMAYQPEPVAELEPEPVAEFEGGGTDLPGAVFSIDPVLLEILKPEVAGHLETVDAWLATCAARGPQPVTDPLLRSIHTMNGAFAMTEVVMITDVTAPLEGFVKRTLAHHLTPTAEGVAVIADAAKAIRATIVAMEKPRPVLPHFEELSARAYALRDALPDSTLSSVPAQVEEEAAAMPQVVMLEAADVSAIPQFEAAPEPEAEAVPEIEVAEAAIAAPVEAYEPELAVEELEQPAAIEATVEAEPEAAPAMDLYLGEMAQVQIDGGPAVQDEPELAEELGLVELEAAQPAFEEMPAASEIEATAIDEPLSFEEEAVALGEEPISFEQETASFEQEAASFEQEAASFEQEAASFEMELAANEPEPASVEPEAMSFGQDYAAVEEPTTTSDRDFALEEIPVSFEEASAPTEAGSYALHEPAESLVATPEAAEEAPLALEEVATSREEPAPIEAETVDADEPVEEAPAHAELPESEMLSLEDFLRQGSSETTSVNFAEVQPDASMSVMQIDESEEYAGQAMDVEEAATDASTAMEFELPGAAASDSMEISEVQADAVPSLEIEERDAGSDAYSALPPISAAEAASFDAEASAELAAPIEQAPEAADSAEFREQVEFTAPAGFDAPELAEVADEDAVDASVEDSVEAEATDAALAGMIAAYPADEETGDVAEVASEFEQAPATAGGVFSAEELANADDVLSKGLQFADSQFDVEASLAAGSDAEPQPTASDPVVADATPGSDYYGMSLDELEAMTAPESHAPESVPVEATVEVDGFADLPSISELPAWKGETESQAVLETAGRDADANFPVQAEVTAEAEAEAFAAPEVAAEPAAEPEVAEAADAFPEPEIADQPEPVAEPETAEEPELVAEQEIAEEPELVAEQETAVEPEVAQLADQAVEELEEEELEEEEIFDDEPEVVAVAPVAAAEPVRASRPNVPTAHDEADPETELDVTDLDTELLDLFLEESNDILDHSDGMLARLRDHIDDRETIVNLQRDLHTLKGGARMAGIYAVGELGHAMESLLESVAEGRQKLDATGVVVLERGFDRLHGMVARIGSRKAIALPAGLIAQVEALSEGKSLSEVEVEEPSAPTAKKGAPSKPAAVEAPTMNPLSAPVDEMAAEDEMSGVRAPQEQVRIRADLLDRLVNYAGEVAIYRARLEQQLGAFRSNLGELDQTTTRLREQLRRLDIETEAQIVARYQREGEDADERFDPLELDRFTNQQQLTRALNESANDLVNLQGVLDELTRQYETLLLQQSRVSSDLQEGLMRTRMVPFDALVPRLRRVLRQAAIDTGKQVQLKVDGASGEMDRNVLDRMTAPLEHMLRNAMAHGLELPEERRKARKSEEGIVRIAVQREGSEVVLKVIDDGRGLNKTAIRNKAIERGLIKADAEMSDEALYGMILEAGFSTAETVSRLSGRGVGMDVVYSEIRQLGGTLQIASEQGKGSEFTIRLPFTLAVTQAVFVKIGDTSFAVPIASVRGVGRVSRAELEKQLASEHPVFNYAGEDYAIHDLGTLIGHAPAKAQDSLQMPLLLARSGDLRTAISIDQVLGSREIVVKPVGPQVNSVPGIFGATIMGDGRVVVILDVAPLVRRHMAVVKEAVPVVPVAVVPAHRVPVIMVVDDSITMRKVTGRVLERNNMEVLTAKDGVDAVEKMAERVPDLVLLDIEMPRMDGYEVAQNMKSDPRLKDVPIIMITSRTGDKHRQRAMDIGVDRYLGKPYQEQELMRNVFDVLGMEAVND